MAIEFIKHLQIEVFVSLFMFAFALEGLAITQLAQDKICRYRYNQSDDYCALLSEQVATSSVFDFKNQILAEVTTFTLYKTLVNTIPIIFWSLFLGSWADRHERAPKFLMSLVAIASCLETLLLMLNSYYFEEDVNWIILAFLPQSLCGGLLSVMMSIYSYISSTTYVENRTIKFAILEAIIFVAAPIGIFVGGDIIGDVIQGEAGQLHRYTRVFGIALSAQILAALWVVFVPFDKKIDVKLSQTFEIVDNQQSHSSDNSRIYVDEHENKGEKQPLLGNPGSSATTQEIEKIEKVLNLSLSHQEIERQNNNKDCNRNSVERQSPIEETAPTDGFKMRPPADQSMHWYDMFKDLFDVQNIREMWYTCTKKRRGGKRGEIWILIISMTLITFTNNGALGILFQFVQRVFEWDAQMFSIVNASTLLLTSLAVIVVVPILIKVLKFSNMSLSIVGILSIYLQNLIRGSILNAEAFYLSYVIGSLSYVPMISVRSKLSTIVELNEENKVFGLMATLETVTPFFGSILYSTVFNASIATHPGLVFQMSTAILLIPFIGFVYIANYCD